MSCYVAHLSSAHTRHCGIEVNIRLAENKLHLKLIKALVNYTDKIPNSEDLRFDSFFLFIMQTARIVKSTKAEQSKKFY
jgi:hypothetical protein